MHAQIGSATKKWLKAFFDAQGLDALHTVVHMLDDDRRKVMAVAMYKSIMNNAVRDYMACVCVRVCVLRSVGV